MEILKNIQRGLYASLKKSRHYLRPSTIGGCMRKNVLMELNPMDDIPIEEIPEGMLVEKGAAVGGVIIEEKVAPILQKMGFKYQVRILIPYVPSGGGTCDFYYYDPNTEEAIILDLKTTNRSSLRFIPYESHVEQVLVYMDGALNGEIFETKIDENGQEVIGERLPNPKKVRGCIVYLLRENPLFSGYEAQESWVEYDPKKVEEIKEKFARAQEYIEKKEIPPIPKNYSPYQFPCYISSFEGVFPCPFWNFCWAEEVKKSVEEYPEELLRAVRHYHHINEMYHLYKAERERLRAILMDLMEDVDSVMFEGGTLKKIIEIREETNWVPVVESLLTFIGENNKIPLEERVRIVQHYTQLKRKNTHPKVVVKFRTYSGKVGKKKDETEEGNEVD